MIVLLMGLWYLIGIAGFIYWWTSEFDFEAVDFIPAIFVGFLGPLTWGFGYLAHCDNSIIIKRRERK